jgi:hypothetical protein
LAGNHATNIAPIVAEMIGKIVARKGRGIIAKTSVALAAATRRSFAGLSKAGATAIARLLKEHPAGQASARRAIPG